jgi:hypothetical protein
MGYKSMHETVNLIKYDIIENQLISDDSKLLSKYLEHFSYEILRFTRTISAQFLKQEALKMKLWMDLGLP